MAIHTEAEFDTLAVDGDDGDGSGLEQEPQAPETPVGEPEQEEEPPAPSAAKVAPAAPQTPQTRYGSKIKRLEGQAEEAAAQAATERQAREAAEAELQQLRGRLEAMPKVAPAEAVAQEFTFPTMADWFAQPGNENAPVEAYYDQRQDARAAWNEQRTAAQHYEQSLDARYEASAAFTRALHTDFDTVMQKNVELTNAGQLPPLSVELRRAIRESDLSGLVAYHLAGHAEEYRALNPLRGRALVRAIAKLEGRLEAVTTGSASAAPSRSARPVPISPVAPGGPETPEPSPADEEADADGGVQLTSDWLRAENKRQRERGRR